MRKPDAFITEKSLFFFFFLSIIASFAGQAYSATYTVTNTSDSGAGTLRQAILDANTNPGPDTIAFDIPDTDPGYQTSGGNSWWRIAPTTVLPSITGSGTLIDGTTQTTNRGDTNSQGPEIEIDGISAAGSDQNGLTIAGGNITVKSLVINRFGDDGIEIEIADGNTVQGCYIGTDVTGTTARGNDYGISIKSDSNQIGGTTASASNIISGNTNYGVAFYSSAANNVIEGNFIGTNATGSVDLGNGLEGVLIYDGSASNTIGGTADGAGNLIAYNDSQGVMVESTAGTGNAIVGNSIYSNGSLGIDLQGGTENGFGVTANDTGDGDTGPNNLQNYPVLNFARNRDSTTTVHGSLNSAASTTFRIEFFSTAAADASGYGEGQTYLGYSDVTTDGSGDVSFTFETAVAENDVISATATDPSDNTSEFSNSVTVTDWIAMAVWGESGSTIPEYNLWDGTAFGTEGTSANVGQWRTMAGAESPTAGQLGEAIVVGVDSSGNIKGEMWNGSSWSALSLNTLNANPVSETYWYGMDVAYEQDSGDAVVVWNNNTAGNLLQHSVWNGSSWSSKTTISAYTGGEPQHMHLAAKPRADEMVLVVNDVNADHYALVWNGSTWGNAVLLDASGTAESDQTALYAAYEQRSGRAMVVYGKDGIANGFYRIWNGSTWEPEGTISPPAGVISQIQWMVLSSDPISNRIVLGVLTTGGTAADIWLNVWDGSSWGTSLLAETTATGSTYPGVAVAFENSSGQALAAYGENGQSALRYRTWSSGSGWSVEQTDGPNIGATPNTVLLDSDPTSDSGDIMLSVQDSGSGLNYALWNGSSWGTPSQQETNTGETKNQPFVFLWDQTQNLAQPTISSDSDQTFIIDGPATAMSTITVTDDLSTPTITAANDIRIRIPSDFNMSWDTSDTTATIGGGASGKVSTTVSYEDSGKTLVIDVITDFVAADQITIADLSFTSFTAPSPADNLELEVNDDDAVSAYDDKSITINSPMKLATGSYTGNGAAGTAITGLGFQPDVVIIKAADDTQEAVCRTSSMSGDVSKPMGGATALGAYLVQSLDVDGFTIGNDDGVNQSGITYHWVAFQAGVGEMAVESYTGTGVDNTSVTGVGFQPDYVIVLSELARAPVHRSSAQSGDTTLFFNNTASAANHIQALEADGFQVGGDARVNSFNETYHYIAWKAVAGKVAVGLHPGNGTDDTDITGLGFEPEYVVVKQANAKEAVHRPDSLSGDDTLWFVPNISASNMIQELQSDGFQVGNSDKVNKNGEEYYWVAFAGSHLTIASAADQIFNVGDPLTAISTITITDGIDAPVITAADDIRIRIPAGFNMNWDTADLTAVIGGTASGKVATAVTYEDSGQTLVLDVTADFSAGDQITVSGLGFTGFTAISSPDHLELEVDNDDTVTAYDAKMIRIVGPLSISSAVDQLFTLDDPATVGATMTITDDSAVPRITSGNELRIRIPTGFNMTWDTSVTTVTIGGSAAAKVSTTIKAYEDGNQTLVLDVTANFAAGDYVTVSGAKFANFSAVSAADNLELDVDDNGAGDAVDDKTITIIEEPSISSAADQVFLVGDPATAIETITITDATGGSPMITAANDIRIRIPSSFNMTWDTADTAAAIGGGASGKVSTTVSYEDGGRTLVLDVITDFVASDQITVSALSFTNFSAASQADQLELEINNDDVVTDHDDRNIKILDPAEGQRDIDPDPNLELIPAGSLVIAMDNDKQNLGGSAFNLKAYGLVNSLLWDEIPVKWAIKAGKAKDGIDFSAEAQRVFPSTLPAATLDFRAGPFIIHEYWAAEARPKIAAFGNDVAVYVLTEDVTVDIRYTLTHKPKVGVLSDGGTSGIHAAILDSAGFVSGTHYSVIPAASLLTVNADSCYTFVSEPHFDSDDSNSQAEAVRSFVESSGNFLAQCVALISYENNATYGHFQTTNGIVQNNLGNDSFIYANPDLTYSQFQGDLDDTGGSTTDFELAPSSVFHNDGHLHVHNTPQTDLFVASASKLTVGVGSMVFYLGGHSYGSGSVEEINGKRMYLNAVITPSGRPTDCQLNFPADMVQPSISSAANQFFIQGDPPTAIRTITITDDEDTPTITAANDIRIRIPSGFNMTWDTSDTTAVIGGGASGKVSTTVSYEDGGKTLVIEVASDFAASDQITIAGLSFMNFTGTSVADNLELEVANDDTVAAVDDKDISIGPPTISSAADQTFSVGDPPTAISTITVTEADTGTTIKAAKDIRIRIPAGLNMTWDTADTTAIIGGSAAARVSTTVSYEDSGKTLVLDVLADFEPSDDLTISGLSFANFIAVSAPNNLGLEVRNDGYVQATDDKTITIVDINISSAADQTFAVNDPPTAISPITVTDDSNSPLITAGNDIRIHIPAGFNMTWDTSDTAAVISGPAAAKVSGIVSYEDGGKTLVLDVISDFNAWDQITVSGLSFTGFTAASGADNLELEVYNDGTTVATDDKTKAVGAPTISSAADQTFYEADPPTAISTITVTEDGSTPTITAGNDIRIRIPAGFNMSWDTSDTTAVIGGAAASKVSTTLSYEDGGQTLVLDVTSDFAAGDQITVAGLSFTSFGASIEDNLELEVNNADTVAAFDDKTITVHSRMKIRTGSYTGNGIAGTPITGLKFQPDVVIIKVADDTKEGVIRTSTMTGDNSKPMGGATALTANLIQSLDADGFTVGSDDRVNKSGKTYHWIAFEAGAGEMVVDSYIGNKTDGTSITGVGFQPDYVMVLPAMNKEPVHRSSEQSGDSTMYFKNLASVANHIQALEADGFQLGDDDRVNKLNETYHYIAWKEVAGKMAVGTHAGNDTDGTEISGLGFAPEYVIMKQDNAKEAVHRPDSLSGDNTLWFVAQAAAADMIQELQSDGFQLGISDKVNKSGENYFWMAFAGEHLTISSAANQIFHVADPPTAISTITITEDYLDPTITAANDIRIRIPATFNMTWDTTDTAAVIGGGAAGKVSATVSYEDGGQTLVINVTTDFSASDQLTISGLSFTNFSDRSPVENLELEVDNGDTVAAVDDKYIVVVAPTISSAANQYFVIGSPAKVIQTITITEDSYGPSITAANDIRIRIPAGFNMTWDTSDTTATIGGSAVGKVSTTVSYEDGGQTLVVDVTGNFAASDQITISDLSFTDFTAASLPDNLELEVDNDGTTAATDDKTIAIGDISISSAANQEFIVGDPSAAINTITITEDSTTAIITAANDIRIRIPDDFYMLWDTSDTSAVIGGSAAAKVSTTVSYEDAGKTLVLNVTSNFAASDQITVSGLSFTNFTAASHGDRLELEVFNDGVTTAEDDKWKAIGGTPSAGSMLVYGEGIVNTTPPRYRTWDGSSFSAEGSALPANAIISWVVLKPSPVENEMILGVYSSSNETLYIQTWNGSSWTSNWSTFMDLPADFRGFDIAYEQNSGDAIVVFSNDTTDTLKYRKRVGGIWDSTDQTITGLSLGDEANWVRAESRPGSDDIFVAAQTNSKTLFALRWNGAGNSWGDQLQTTALVKNAPTEAFDIAFESATGDAFLVFGDDATKVWYREFTSSWQAETLAYTLPDDVFWLTAAYDPQATGSKIAIGAVLENNTFEFGAWNGSSWVARPAAIAAPNRDNRFIDVAFESDSGEAVYGFTQNVAGDDKKKFAWRTWTSSGGFSSVTVTAGLSDEIKFVQLKADPQSDDIMAVYADKSADLYHRYWDGSSWTALKPTLEATVSDADKNEAFMFAWKESPPTAVDLISFSAKGQDVAIQVAWQTAQEINNLGFYVYRAAGPSGPYTRLTDKLIPGLSFSVIGRKYSYIDTGVVPGTLYYYRLEDIDGDGTRTFHGPVCVDWDGDGMPDDWELAHGLDPKLDDAGRDPDGDGLTNLEEFERGTDPMQADAGGSGTAGKDSDPDPMPWTPPVQDPMAGDPTPQEGAAASLGPLSDSVYKLTVSGEGIYRLSHDDLSGHGVAVDQVDLSQVRLYHRGREAAIWVYDENADTIFDAADHITFYALPVDGQYAKYTAANVYWLTTGARDTAAKRIVPIDAAPTAAQPAGEFSALLHQELDQYYFPAAPGPDELDRWFYSAYVLGDEIDWPGAGDPVPFALTVPGVADSGKLTISMLGTYDTSHKVEVSVNGGTPATFTWKGVAFYEAVIEGLELADGINTVTVTCKSGLDMILIDWLEVHYPRHFEAKDDRLKFSATDEAGFRVSNFSGNELWAFDITDPDAVTRMVNVQTTGEGPYRLEFTPPDDGGEPRSYLVLSTDAMSAPDAMEADRVSHLADPANEADYIVITHRDLGWDANGEPYGWLNNLAALRQAQGLRVKAVNLTDIYDEFSFGLAAPAAVRDFLAYACQFWTPPAPQYVLLVGDASYDFKDNWGLGSQPDVPGYLIFTEHMGETVTDQWFGWISGQDTLADVYIGRLPAATPNEAAVMVDKIISYESAPNSKTWEKKILLVADNRTADYEAIFEAMSEEAAAMIPAGFDAPFKGYLNAYATAADLAHDLQAQLNAGALLLNFSGHSSVQIWTHENIFDTGDVAGLSNGGRYPFIVNMTCLTGYLAYPAAWNFPSLAEVLLRAQDKGAAAALMPTAMTAPEGQQILNRALFDAILRQDVRQLGPALSAARQTLLVNDGMYEEVSRTFLLFGDPAMELKVPLPHRPTGLAGYATAEGRISLSWSAASDCNGDPVAGYHVYRSTTSGQDGYARITTNPVSGTLFVDGAVELGMTYTYVVTAMDADGDESVRSSQILVALLDSDADGLADEVEAGGCSDPNIADTDGDGLLDGVEDVNHNGGVDSGETDPCNADTDGDDLPDGWEAAFGLDPLDNTGSNGKNGDPDGDGWSNYKEYLSSTDPTNSNDVPHAPTAPAINSPADGDETSTRQPLLSVSNAMDQDSQTLAYFFEVYADAGLTRLVAQTPAPGIAEGQGTTSWQVDVTLDDNRLYYWRARAYDHTAYGAWTPTAGFFVNTAPDAPSYPGVSSPPDGSEVTTLQPTLEVTNAADADRDALTYEFAVYADQTLSELITFRDGVVEGTNGTTAWQVDVVLENHGVYWWVVRASDEDGLIGPWSAPASLRVNIANDAPSAPALSSPFAGEEVNSVTPVLEVHNSTDLDLDRLTYSFEIDCLNTFDSPALEESGEIAEGAGSTTSWRPSALSDNTWYYWRVRAFDGAAYSGWTTGDFFVNTANDPPSTPAVSNPGDRSEVTSRQPRLGVQAAGDVDLDQLAYDYEVFADPALADLVTSVYGAPDTWQVDAVLADNAVYYWRVRAVDEHGAVSAWSSPVSFFVNTAHEHPSAPAPNNPVSGGTVTTLMPTLSVTNAYDADHDVSSYEFELYADRALSVRLGLGSVPQGEIISSWSVPLGLTDQGTYYWRARAFDGIFYSSWMPTAMFVVDTLGAETRQEIQVCESISGQAQVVQIVRVINPGSPIFNASVEIPPGAVSNTCPADCSLGCNVTIGIVTNPPALPQRVKAVGRVIEFGPTGLCFHRDAPAHIKLPVSQAELKAAGAADASQLGVFYYDPASLSWVAVSAAEIDRQTNLIGVAVEHFSMFALGRTITSDEVDGGGSSGGSGGCFVATVARNFTWHKLLMALGIAGFVILELIRKKRARASGGSLDPDDDPAYFRRGQDLKSTSLNERCPAVRDSTSDRSQLEERVCDP